MLPQWPLPVHRKQADAVQGRRRSRPRRGTQQTQRFGIWLATIESRQGLVEARLGGRGLGEQREAGAKLHRIDIAAPVVQDEQKRTGELGEIRGGANAFVELTDQHLELDQKASTAESEIARRDAQIKTLTSKADTLASDIEDLR